MPYHHKWKPEEDAKAIKLRLEGLSSQQIADELGIHSRNAIIGRFFRLKAMGVEVPDSKHTNHRTSRLDGTPKRPPGIPNVVAPFRQPQVVASIMPLDLIPVVRVGFFDLQPNMCRYPLWGDRERPALADRMFCGSAAPIDRPYCACHAVRCYEPAKPNRSTSIAPRRAA